MIIFVVIMIRMVIVVGISPVIVSGSTHLEMATPST